MLIIVEDRNIHTFSEFTFDVKALWGLDVLEVNAAKGWAQRLDNLDKLVRI